MTKPKEFDSVAFMRQQREQLSRELEGKSPDEVRRIIQERLRGTDPRISHVTRRER